MTSSNEVFFPRGEDYNNWKQEVNTYSQVKKEFQGKPDPTDRVLVNKIKATETLYNPIT